MKYCTLFIVVSLFVMANSSVAQTKNNISSENPKQFVNLLGLGEWSGNMFLARLETSYMHNIKENLYFGGKIDYKTGGNVYKRIGVGPTMRYIFAREKCLRPFVEADLMVLNTWFDAYTYYWSPNNETNLKKYSYLGASAKLWAGFQYRRANKHLGFEVKVGVGAELFKPNNNAFIYNVIYKSNNYTYKRESYLQLGLIYSF